MAPVDVLHSMSIATDPFRHKFRYTDPVNAPRLDDHDLPVQLLDNSIWKQDYA